jgi:acylphosphatase
VRRRYYFSGHVQGVGFRATCRHLAGGYDVAGHVRNLPDGRVELLAEGDASEIDRFLAEIDMEMGVFIRRTDVNDESPGYPTVEGFSIRI